MEEKVVENWIRSVKSGDQIALKLLLEKYMPIIKSMERRYYVKDLDGEDWIQEGWIVLYQSILSYNHEKGVSLGLYFKINFERRIYSLVRKQNSSKRVGELWLHSLEERYEHSGETFVISESGSQNHIDEELGYSLNIPIFLKQLSFTENKAFLKFVEGVSISDIAMQMKLSENQVQSALGRAKIKFKQHIVI